MSFKISSLPKSQFAHLFDLSDDELKSARAKRTAATKKPGFPCRVSLADAEVGEEVLLVHYEHHAVDSPFRSSHAIFLRPGALQANCKPGEVPEMFRSRILSLRGFDKAGMMVQADLSDGKLLEGSIEAFFLDPAVSYIHLHFAKPGCYAARVDRAGQDTPYRKTVL